MKLSGFALALVFVGFLAVVLLAGRTDWLRPVGRQRLDDDVVVQDDDPGDIPDDYAPSRSDD